MAGSHVPDPAGGYRNAPGVGPNPVSLPGPQPQPWLPPADTYSVNTNDLEEAARGFYGLAADAEQLHQALTSTLSGNDSGGSPWGTDALGQSFGGQYIPARDAALGAMQGLAAILQDISSSLQKNARIFQDTEDANIQAAKWYTP